MIVRHDDDDVVDRLRAGEGFQRKIEDRPPADGDELFGLTGTQSGAHATGQDDCERGHFPPKWRGLTVRLANQLGPLSVTIFKVIHGSAQGAHYAFA